MDNLKKLFSWISSLPKIGKIISILALVLFLVVYLFFTSSCGASRSTVRVYNRADSTTTTISVSNGDGGSTTVNVQPQLDVKVDSTNIL